MKKQAGIRKRILDTRSTTILPLITDFIFVSIAVYLLLNYVRVILAPEETLLFLAREVLLILYLLMALVLLALRRNATTVSVRKVEYVYTVIGFGAPLFFQPTALGGSFLFGAILELAGLVLVAGAFLSLGRSFGLAPENRGIRTGGAYRFVRHPMYLGYILAEAGYVFDSFSGINAVVLAVSVIFLVLRLRAEEQLLRRDPTYRRYASRVRWRLLPFVF